MAAERALAVNDDADACELVARILESGGWSAGRCTDLDKAADVAVEEAYDIVVIDSLSAGMTGALRLLDELRSSPLPDIAVVLLASTDTNRLFAFQSGADGFLVRPIHADEIVAEVRAVLERGADERVDHRRAQVMGAV